MALSERGGSAASPPGILRLPIDVVTGFDASSGVAGTCAGLDVRAAAITIIASAILTSVFRVFTVLFRL